MIDAKALLVEEFGLSVSNDGNHIMITFGGAGSQAGLAVPHEKVVALIGLISDAATKAAELRHSTPNLKLLLPVNRWEFKHLGDPNVVVLSFGLPNAMDISFGVPYEMSAQMRDALSMLLDKKAHRPPLEQFLN